MGETSEKEGPDSIYIKGIVREKSGPYGAKCVKYTALLVYYDVVCADINVDPRWLLIYVESNFLKVDVGGR